MGVAEELPLEECVVIADLAFAVEAGAGVIEIDFAEAVEAGVLVAAEGVEGGGGSEGRPGGEEGFESLS
jgi:hypothetical protein